MDKIAKRNALMNTNGRILPPLRLLPSITLPMMKSASPPIIFAARIIAATTIRFAP